MEYKLRVHVMGAFVDIKSPVGATEFLQGMCSLINQRSADTSWTGYHQFEALDGSVVWVRVRSIDIVEDITNKTSLIQEDTKPTPKKRKTAPKKKATKQKLPVAEEEVDLYK
jgi:hypothetical protein